MASCQSGWGGVGWVRAGWGVSRGPWVSVTTMQLNHLIAAVDTLAATTWKQQSPRLPGGQQQQNSPLGFGGFGRGFAVIDL